MEKTPLETAGGEAVTTGDGWLTTGDERPPETRQRPPETRSSARLKSGGGVGGMEGGSGGDGCRLQHGFAEIEERYEREEIEER
ncbi:hypothetical protein Dsin_032218 [Dipteronia sinensis]|uniref:Uncharacterized protein n=1 Tax=Dipteronia sinensis TaxID=43782 RepID=A0AAD9ZMY6_9ROSI|nr:hypothetical protein Dsin_032218 [Dipteronia sinensis]